MKPNKVALFLVFVLVFFTLLATYFIAKANAKDKLQQGITIQLQQLVNELEIILGRHAYLPALIADDQAVIDFMDLQINPRYTEDDESHEAQ